MKHTIEVQAYGLGRECIMIGLRRGGVLQHFKYMYLKNFKIIRLEKSKMF